MGYNVQTAVDAETGMTVDFHVNIRVDDKGNLFSVSEKAKEILAVENLTVLADKGYYDGQDLAKCEANDPALNIIKCWICPVGTKPKNNFRKNNLNIAKAQILTFVLRKTNVNS